MSGTAIITALTKIMLSKCEDKLINFNVNFSLTSGQFHPILKESVISPLLK